MVSFLIPIPCSPFYDQEADQTEHPRLKQKICDCVSSMNIRHLTKSIPCWTAKKILYLRLISGHYFSWEVLTELVYRLTTEKARVYSETITLGEKLILKKLSSLELTLCACLYFKQLLSSFHGHCVSQNLVRLVTNKQ